MDGGSEGSFELDRSLRELVLEGNMPSTDEMKSIKAASSKLMKKAGEIIIEMGMDEVMPMLAGSVAKGTMTRNPDLDLFLLFPPETPEKLLEKKGLKIGRKLLDSPERKYTQHPYLTGHFMGMRCDVVPCLHLPKGHKVVTAVDRTPHHTAYINSRVSGTLLEEIIMLKSFFKGIGVYGAEDTVQGFSGYLVEILVLYFGGFSKTVEYLSGLKLEGSAPGGCEEIMGPVSRQGALDIVLFDTPELVDEPPGSRDDYARSFGKDALIVIDPVDPSRNVASPISRETLDYTVRASRSLITTPSRYFFSPFSSRPYSTEEASGVGAYQGSIFSIQLPKGDPGVTSTQLRRYLRKLKGELGRSGFREVQMRYLLRFSGDVEIEPGYLRARNTWSKPEGGPEVLVGIMTDPPVLEEEYIHWGPPLHNLRVKDFNLKWGDRAMIDEARSRVYTMIARDETSPERISLSIWEEMHRGGSFVGMEIRSIDQNEIPSRILDTFEGNFLPWLR